VSASAKAAHPCQNCGAKGAKRVFSTFATEWMPQNVSWHNMPSKHDLGGAPDSRPSASFSKAIPAGGGKDKGGKKGKGGKKT